MFGSILTRLTIATVIIMITSHWFLSKGNLKIVYRLNVIGYSLYIIIETMLALRNPEQWSVLFFNITNLMGLLGAIKGILRLKNEK